MCFVWCIRVPERRLNELGQLVALICPSRGTCEKITPVALSELGEIGRDKRSAALCGGK